MAILLMLFQLVSAIATLILTTLHNASIHLSSRQVLLSMTLKVRRTAGIAAANCAGWTWMKTRSINSVGVASTWTEVRCHHGESVSGILFSDRGIRSVGASVRIMNIDVVERMEVAHCSLAPRVRRLKVGAQVMVKSLYGPERIVAARMEAMK